MYLYKRTETYRADVEAAAVAEDIIEALQPADKLQERIAELVNIQARLVQEATKKIDITSVNSCVTPHREARAKYCVPSLCS